MRNALFTLLLSVAGALGMTVFPGNAQAYDNTRIYVHLGDVGFSYGRPYWRHDNTPLYVTYDRYHRPRYYRHGPRRVYRRDYYEPYYDSRVVVRPRVVYRSYDYRPHYNDRHGHGYRDRYWVDRYGHRHYYRH